MKDIQELIQHIRQQPENPRLLLHLAKMLEEKGNARRSHPLLQNALNVWKKLTEVLEKQGIKDGAKVCEHHANFLQHILSNKTPAINSSKRDQELRALSEATSAFEQLGQQLNGIRDTISDMRRIATDFNDARQRYRDRLADNTLSNGSVNPATPGVNEGYAMLSDHQQVIGRYLAKCGMVIESVREKKSFDRQLDQLAVFMGRHFQAIEPVYQRIKKGISGNGNGKRKYLQINLRQCSESDLSSINQFCDKLHELSFIGYKNYKKRRLHLKTSTDSISTHFISGGWLERFVRRQLHRTLRNNLQERYAYISRINVNIPDIPLRRELDLLAVIENDIYWFEVKTRDPQEDIEKYRHLRHLLNLPRERSFLIVESDESIDVGFIENAYGIQVVSLEQLPARLEEIVQAYVGSNDNGKTD